MKIQEYLQEDGSSPYKKWFDSLDAEAAAKVVTAKLRMERGLTSAIKWFDGIGEYKIDWGPGYRIYLANDGDQLIVLFGGGTKKHQETDIEEAKLLHKQYKDRKAKLKADEDRPKAEKDKSTRKRRR
ncbi:MAG: type II toxin-antitoxin system RelE/ParE family toxin [Cyanobacteria bacterium REEB67]|nr:type II toxin-antitoxin system RelE/ParE family toxin [Cyanobacteria bacterium REEB67]